MNKEQLRMQMLAGIITEGQYKKMLNEAFINDKGELEDFDFEDDLVVKYTPEYYQNEKSYKFFYCEKGLADDFDTEDSKKVKYIVGYSHFLNLPDDKKWILNMPDPKTELELLPGLALDPDSCYDADMDVIGYIYSKSGKDIETEYEENELLDAFYDSLGA
jgi:hypothetical protein